MSIFPDENSWAVWLARRPIHSRLQDAIEDHSQHDPQTWLPQSEYEHSRSPDFDFYDKDLDPAKGTGLYIFIPVMKKE